MQYQRAFPAATLGQETHEDSAANQDKRRSAVAVSWASQRRCSLPEADRDSALVAGSARSNALEILEMVPDVKHAEVLVRIPANACSRG